MQPSLSSTCRLASGVFRHWLAKYRHVAVVANLHIASQLVDFLCGDHTFRIAKYSRNADGAQLYLALFSIRNQCGNILGHWFTHTASLVELKEALQKSQKRYEAAVSPVLVCL